MDPPNLEETTSGQLSLFELIQQNKTRELHIAIAQDPSELDKISTIKSDWPASSAVETIGQGTPLHYAILSNRVFCVMVLLKAGANTQIQFAASSRSSPYSNKTATEIAMIGKNDDIISLINTPAKHRHGADDIQELKQQILDLEAEHEELVLRMDERDLIIRDLQRFVKGEQKRKIYARS